MIKFVMIEAVITGLFCLTASAASRCGLIQILPVA